MDAGLTQTEVARHARLPETVVWLAMRERVGAENASRIARAIAVLGGYDLAVRRDVFWELVNHPGESERVSRVSTEDPQANLKELERILAESD